MKATAAQRVPAGPVDPPLSVLLFYHVTPLVVAPELAWQTAQCAALGLTGRLRVAAGGLNGTLSGATEALRAYAHAVEERHVLFHMAVRVGAAASASGGAPEAQGRRDRIDWKLDAILDASQLFASLRVRPVAELVTLGVPAALAPLDDAGAHISPREFHRLCLGAAAADPRAAPVLLDVRNAYEWRIGRFAPPEGVRTLLPPLRHFSELPAWLAPRMELFKGRDVLLYCTGGVRCEAASALLKGMLRQACDDDDEAGEDPRVGGVGGAAEETPPGVRDANLTQGCEAPAPDCSARAAAAGRAAGGGRVLQLEGGIVRYLEAFPDSSLFSGRNLVFDGRNVELSSAEPIGECVGCAAAVGDYDAGVRCCRCRALLLVCGACAAQQHQCERCSALASAQRGEASPQGPFPPLRILCLHGFRQTADGLRGRLGHLARKLGPLVELVFLDAPHLAGALQLERSHTRRRCWLHEAGPAAIGAAGGGGGGGGCSHVAGDAESGGNGGGSGGGGGGGHSGSGDGSGGGGTSGGDGGGSGDGDGGGSDGGAFSAAFTLPPTSADIAALATAAPPSSPAPTCLPARAADQSPRTSVDSITLGGGDGGGGDGVGGDGGEGGGLGGGRGFFPGDHRGKAGDGGEGGGVGGGEGGGGTGGGRGGAPADGASSPAEWARQTEGWGATEACVRRAVAESGPFDGLLGVAQGAAVAAALAAISARETAAAAACAPGDGEAAPALSFRFVVLCSGFVAAVPEHARLFSAPVDCPSLHIVGHSDGFTLDSLAAAGAAARTAEGCGGGANASELLARLFRKSSRVMVRHAAGNVLPCSDRHIRLFKDFFMRFHPPLTSHAVGGGAAASERALGTSHEAQERPLAAHGKAGGGAEKKATRMDRCIIEVPGTCGLELDAQTRQA